MRVAALSEAQRRPKVELLLYAHAPKLALPHPDGHTVLILDLGRLQLRADRYVRCVDTITIVCVCVCDVLTTPELVSSSAVKGPEGLSMLLMLRKSAIVCVCVCV